jgi:UDP-N-acetylmuramoylalanine--D-glutamate ligase
MDTDYRGRRATIMGLGHFGGGVTAARWLAGQDAIVTISDTADETALADSLAQLADVPIAAVHFGGHREEDFRDAELVVVNPAVRPNSPWLQLARRSAGRLVTELELFMENCPGRIIGVTGTNGKSTTAAMIASILMAGGHASGRSLGEEHLLSSPLPLGEGQGVRAAPLETEPVESPPPGRPHPSPLPEGEGTGQTQPAQVFLGGNLGGSLLERLPEIGPQDWVVLEVSSFQLWHFGPAARMPHVAVVTGCSPNHLDWHGSYADYVAAKQRMLTGQTPDDIAVLNTLDGEVAGWSRLIHGRLMPLFSLDELPPLCVPGRHNRINAACAAAVAAAVGCDREAIGQGLARFRPLPQRLEWLAVVEGRRFYNDSAATTPESTIAALESLDMPVWLLAGGKSKGAQLAPLAAEIARRAQGAALFGSTGEELRDRIRGQAPQFPCIAVETMDEALGWCWRRSRPAEAIVLSPACASTDQFRNFRHRGEHFVELVRRLANPLNR